MTDKIIPLQRPSKPREATCTHEVPSETPDRFKRSSDLRVPTDLVDSEALHRLGFGEGIPHSEGSRRVGVKLLREWRCWHLQQAAVISELLGDDDGGSAA